MDQIRAGIDFGTHQTKICIQRIPDEGHGMPIYEFFKFDDAEGNQSYFLPSVVQINDDNTLSYGFVDKRRLKSLSPKPMMSDEVYEESDANVLIDTLLKKYAPGGYDSADRSVIEELVSLKIKKEKAVFRQNKERQQDEYTKSMRQFNQESNYFRYFKQATFADRFWDMKYNSRVLSIWYLSYVIFLLEERYGMDFSINMGIPVDADTYSTKKKLAVSILLSAYHLVEDVFQSDMERFLSTKVEDLYKLTTIVPFTEEKKDEFNIQIFPEAYASLISLTTKGKISNGMNVTVDAGGGTTDISFFTINNNKPVIYRYWSIPKGLNYIAEKSGFDYFDGGMQNAKHNIIQHYNESKKDKIEELIRNLKKQLIKETNIPVSALVKALEGRVVVYTGGGSTFKRLNVALYEFNDIMLISKDLWREENVIDKQKVSELCQILSTAYGLSLGESDEDVKICPFTSLFATFPPKYGGFRKEMVDKDMC